MTQIALTTLANVKERLKVLGGSSDNSLDSTINRIIPAVSRKIEIYLGRPLLAQSRTEEYDFEQRKTNLWLRAYPVTQIDSVKLSLNWDWTNAVALQTAGYHFDADTGELVFDMLMNWTPAYRTNTRVAPKAVQVIYTGGIGPDTNTIMTNYPDIAEACEIECVMHYVQGKNPTGSAKRLHDDTVQYDAPMSMTKQAKELLYPYRRQRFGLG
jgi:hypothetical protein